jgi:hypothetical protein
MAKVSRYFATGFIPLDKPPARRHALIAANISILKGDVLFEDANGDVTNTPTALTNEVMGVAAAPCNNTAGSTDFINRNPAVAVAAAEAFDVEYYPIGSPIQYVVPVAQNALITQAAVGDNVDLQANNTIDHSDAVTEGLSFMIDEIDVSAPAIAANAFGYAIGHFTVVGTQAP